MRTDVVMERIAEASPRLKARIAGVFYLLAVLTAAFAEGFVHGRLLSAAGLIPVACFVVVTLLLYQLFKPVNRNLALLAALFNLVSLTFEALELHLSSANVALIFHGLYCLVIGYLIFRSAFLPRILGLLMAIGGLAWLTDLSIPITNHLSPYNVITGFTGEGLLMLWLLAFGVNAQRLKELGTAAAAEAVKHPVIGGPTPMPETKKTTVNFDDWLILLKKKSQQLGYTPSLAFAASCCERSLPNYDAFSRQERWGDSKILKEALDLVWWHVVTRNPSNKSQVEPLSKAIDAVTPDTENFESPLTSAALDAANSVAEALDYTLDRNVDRIVTISSLARDTIDLFVQRRDSLDSSRSDFEGKIASDPLMIAELEKQQLDITILESGQNLTPEFWRLFRQRTAHAGRSNLGIS